MLVLDLGMGRNVTEFYNYTLNLYKQPCELLFINKAKAKDVNTHSTFMQLPLR